MWHTISYNEYDIYLDSPNVKSGMIRTYIAEARIHFQKKFTRKHRTHFSFDCCFTFICTSIKLLLDFLFSFFAHLNLAYLLKKVNLLIIDNLFSTGMRFYDTFIAIAMKKCTKCLFLIRINLLLHFIDMVQF